ncbi:uncharacterized protein [Typha latifolia]|uniref:uncharacterized protein n=1 Tax=Typha latifolia TaxID=4733 RepID=UPI003C2D5A8D
MAPPSHLFPLGITLPFVLFLIPLFVDPALARGRHVITFSGRGIQPSGLAWDPTAQHFLVGSLLLPAVSSVSDAGVFEILVSDPSLGASSPAVAVAVDDRRRRLLVAFSQPPSLAAYDLRSPIPHSRLFAAHLPDSSADPGGVAVDWATGDAFVTAGDRIWRIDTDGKPSLLSRSAIYEPGLGGLAHVSKGFLLAVQVSTGRVIKVDEEDGAAKAAIGAGGGDSIAVRSDGSAVAAGGRRTTWLTSDDGWAEVAAYDEAAVEKGTARGVAIREGKKAYVLVSPETEEGSSGTDGEEYNGKRWRIEEVEWGREGEGEMVWGFVLLGLGLAYFLYWRFQMRQLVSNMNKKSA